MTPELRQHFDDLVKTHPVVLFMKGNRRFPQCGFSSSVVQVLNELVSDFKTVDVLQDAAVRDGIKLYSDWPTIPQLYIKGEFVGGADIVREMYQKGELQKLLGVSIEEIKAPTITLTDAAAKAILAASKDASDEPLHLAIDARFQNKLDFAPANSGDIEVMANGVKLLVDRATAKRADGLIIDFLSEGNAQGFKLDNPNAPAQVKQLSVQALKALLDAQRPIELFDVRGDDERVMAKLSQSRKLDDDAMNHIARLPKDTALYFICHHGGRSQRAAAQLIEQGYRQVYNVSGGIDAWSLQIDSSIPRY